MSKNKFYEHIIKLNRLHLLKIFDYDITDGGGGGGKNQKAVYFISNIIFIHLLNLVVAAFVDTKNHSS